MKKIMLVGVLLSAIISQGEYSGEFIKGMRKGADTFVEIAVINDEEMPVSNALVSVCYNIGTGREETHGPTDGGGKYSFRKRTNGYGEIDVTKDGFYRSESQFSFIDMGHECEVVKGEWQPSPLPLKILLKRKRNPIPLINVSGDYSIPSTNEWFGFDLKEKSWVRPSGHGEVADFKVRLEWDGKMQWECPDMKLNFDFNGINAYLSDTDLSSKFPYAYEAITNGFNISDMSYYRIGTEKRIKKEFSPRNELILRSRCNTNSTDNIVLYNYTGIVHIDFFIDRQGNPMLRLGAFFNSTPNDVNLEPKK